jgi:hypothetical protein
MERNVLDVDSTVVDHWDCISIFIVSRRHIHLIQQLGEFTRTAIGPIDTLHRCDARTSLTAACNLELHRAANCVLVRFRSFVDDRRDFFRPWESVIMSGSLVPLSQRQWMLERVHDTGHFHFSFFSLVRKTPSQVEARDMT